MHSTRFKVLMSDIGGVVAPFDSNRFGEELLPYAVASVDEDAPKSAGEINALIFGTVRGMQIIRLFETGKLTRGHYFDVMRRFLRTRNIPEEKFWRIHNASMMWIDTDVVCLLQEVRQCKRVKVVAVTDTDIARMLHIDQALRSEHEFSFDLVVPSYNVGAMKSEQEFWEKALIEVDFRLGTNIRQPHECLVVDDNPAYVAFAQKLGFCVHQYHDAQQLREVLNRCGLLQEQRHPSANP
jgi:FMN phosphatase YigB (HAD superfamily)